MTAVFKSPIWLLLVVVLLAAGIFVLDLAAPTRAACGTLYVIVVLLALRFPHREATLVAAVFCSLLIVSATVTVLTSTHYIEAVQVQGWIAPKDPQTLILNSMLELFAIWVAATFGYHKRGLEDDLTSARDELQQRVQRRSEQLRRANRELRSVRVKGKSIQQALQDEKAHYLSLIENLPIHVIRKDRDGCFTFASLSFCERVGASLDEIIGKTDYDLYPDDLAVKYRADDQRVMEHRQVVNEVETNQLSDGSTASVQVIKFPISDESGNVTGMQGIFWDVTERMQAEDELRESEARKRAILDSAMDCIVFLNETGVVVEVNPAALMNLDCRREQILQKPLAEIFVSPQSREQFRKNLESYTDERKMGSMLGRRIEAQMTRHDGTEFLAELSAQPIRLQGSPGFAIFFRDITQRKMAEENLRSAKDAAVQASHAKSLFVANMSHEIRTPMNAIVGFLDLLYESGVSADQREYMKLIQESTDLLLTVIDDILDFSKIEAGKLDLEEIEFHLRDRIGDVIRSLGVRSEGKGIELIYRIDPSVPDRLLGDPTRLRQVIVNLVGNAIKFTEQGEVLLEIDSRDEEEGVVELVCSVQDTGVGIPASRIEAIFAAFEQADNSIKREFGGTGLGLAICARLVELLEGRIQVQSEVAKGSRFEFTARFKTVHSDGFTQPTETPLAGQRVLLVDDNPNAAAVLGEQLENWGMSPSVAANEKEALAALSDDEPLRVAILDGVMPDCDSFDLAASLRAEDPNCTVILLLSPRQRLEKLGHATTAEVISLAKPVKYEELYQALSHPDGIDPSDVPESDQRIPVLDPLQILLVEDSIVNQKLAEGLLTKSGHTVELASNGVEAVDAFQAHDYDLVLMDIHMPEMDGLEATAEIREHERRNGGHLPIVAMTAHAMKGDREQCLRAGMDGYVAKPIRAITLFETIRDVLSKARAPMDWHHALQVVRGDPELLREIVDAFLEECPKLLATIDRALAEGNAEEIQRAAHTIKGSMRYFGADEAQRLAFRLEQTGSNLRTGDNVSLDGARCEAKEVAAEIDKLMPDLQRFVETGKVPLSVTEC